MTGKSSKNVMIDTIHDLIKLVDKDGCILIYRDRYLQKLLHGFRQSGYEPFV